MKLYILRPLIGNYLIDLGGTVASRVTQDNRTNFINKKIISSITERQIANFKLRNLTILVWYIYKMQ